MTIDLLKPYLLSGTIQNYAWGKPGAVSLVSRYAGSTDASQPFAELWFGTHPKGPTTVHAAGETLLLRDLVRSGPREVLGADVVTRFGHDLPFLFKVLSINDALSIQAHPSTTSNPHAGKRELPTEFASNHAAYLHWKDPAHYPDANHKPEIAVALTTLSLLHGFKPVAELRATLTSIHELASLVGAARVEGLNLSENDATAAEAVREIYRAIVESTAEDRAHHMGAFKQRLDAGETELTWERAHLAKMFASYSAADVGIPTSLLMNWVQIAAGQAVFVAPNELHAYLEGDIIECMASSDNVVRAGLTHKFQDKEELLAMVSVNPGATKILSPEPIDNSAIAAKYRTPAAEFQVATVKGSGSVREEFTARSATFVFCATGEMEVVTGTGAITLREGQLALVPAHATTYELILRDAHGFTASVPTP